MIIHLFFSVICIGKLKTLGLSRSWDDYYPDTPYNQSIQTADPVTYQTRYYYYVNNVLFENLTAQAIYAKSYTINMVVEDTTFTNISSTKDHGTAMFLTSNINLIQNKVCSSKCSIRNNGQHLYIITGKTDLKTFLTSFTNNGNLMYGTGVLSTSNAKNYLTNSNFSKCQCTSYSALNFHYCIAPSNITYCNIDSCSSKTDYVLGKGSDRSDMFLQVNDCTIHNCSCNNNLIKFDGSSMVFNINFIDNSLQTITSPVLINAGASMTLTNCYFQNTPQLFNEFVHASEIRDSKVEIINQNYPASRCPGLEEEIESKIHSNFHEKYFDCGENIYLCFFIVYDK